MTTPEQVLLKSFGYQEFKPGQKDLIENILAGRDVLGIMPTGAGKSVCYQVPALMMDGITLVISPLISLMKDQVAALKANGIPGAFFNSSLTPRQYYKALQLARQYKYKIIYVAPERLLTPAFQDFVQSVNISMVAVDEAHCVSQWGQNFRPSYLQIPEFVKTLKKRPVVAAFTATATGLVKKDIENLLQLQNPHTLTTGFDRPNLYFGVEHPKDKDAFVKRYVSLHKDEPGIIYCLTRKQVEEVHDMLIGWGYSATRYHAGLSDEERHRNQDDFLYDRAMIMVATNAFGMGIDKSNVRYVLHYSMPGSLENYYQEAGRAGRDGGNSECILLYSGRDVRTHKYFLENPASPNPDPVIQEEISRQDYNRLMRMRDYCFTQNCLRCYILEYFGQEVSGSCNNCSVCRTNFVDTDITDIAKEVYTLLTNLPRHYGIAMIADLLKGSKNQKVLSSNLDSTPGYGSLAYTDKKQIQNDLEKMIMNGYLIRSNDQYRTISISPSLRQKIENNEPVTVREKGAEPKRKVVISKTSRFSDELFSRLKQTRLIVAAANGVPPYIVFSDQTLHAMASHMPTTKEEMLEMPGVGEIKFSRYGKNFVQTIERFKKEQEEAASAPESDASEANPEAS